MAYQTNQGPEGGTPRSGLTHHAGSLHRLRHVTGVGLTPEDVALKMLVPSVHDEGERVHVLPDAHEGQESYPALHQDVLFILQETLFSSPAAARHVRTVSHRAGSQWLCGGSGI